MSKCQTKVYSRVTGFYAQVDGYNPGKKEEFTDRKHYKTGGEDEKKASGDNVPRP